MSFWWILLAAIVAVGIKMWLRSSQQISADAARAHLQSGALLVDVRSPGEFNSGHLPDACNMPLDQIEDLAPTKLADKSQTVLLHCQSGMRSRVAQRKLQSMGYTSTFNLGSYARAEAIAARAT